MDSSSDKNDSVLEELRQIKVAVNQLYIKYVEFITFVEMRNSSS